MQGQVSPMVEILPLPAVFFSLYKGQAPEKSVTILNHHDRPLKITGLDQKSDRFTAQLHTVREGQEYALVVQVNPQAALGRTREKVTLNSDNPRQPRLSVGVNILIKDEVYIFPETIDLGKVSIQELKNTPALLKSLIQTVLVKRREGKGKDFQITLDHNIPFINIKKEPEKNSETYRLDVSPIIDKLKPGKIDIFIKVKTNDKDVPELKIPVLGEVL
jgi:hypothetical protein